MDSIVDPTVIPIDQSLKLTPTAYVQNPMVFEPMKSAQQPSIVGGLFNPELRSAAEMEYLQNRQKSMQNEAMAFAQLTPAQQAQFGFYRSGQQLGDFIGGALGGQDPQLRMIGLQQQILSELDPSDPQQQLTIAQKYARVAPELAMKIADNARGLLVKIAQANKERQLAVPADIQKAQMIPQIQDAIDQYLAMPASPERDRAIRLLQNQMKVLIGDKTATVAAPLQVASRIATINQQLRALDPNSVEAQDLIAERTQLQKPEKPEARPSVGSDTERISLEKFGKNYYDLSTDERATVGRLVEADAVAKAPKFQVDLKDPTAVAKANLDVMGKWEQFLGKGGDVEVANRFKAVQSAVASANAGNPSADGALLYNIAKMYDPSGAVQEGDKKTITGNPSLPRRFQLLVQGVLEGGSFTPEQRKELESMANDIVKNRQSQLNVYRKQYVAKIKALDGTEQDILDPYQGLIRPPLSTFTQTPNTNPQNITGGRR